MYDFRLSHEQFLDLTPAKFDALSRRHDESVRLADMGPARICALLANINRDPEKRPEPFSYSDFSLKFGGEEEEPAGGDMSPEEIKARLMKLFPPKTPKPEPEAHGG